MVATDIGSGHEVLVPAHTFITTLWGVAYVGATPVLCDVEDAIGRIDLTVRSGASSHAPEPLYRFTADLAREHNLIGWGMRHNRVSLRRPQGG
jgi:DegT/DnrJ/EryC1/StrS aminotransferase family